MVFIFLIATYYVNYVRDELTNEFKLLWKGTVLKVESIFFTRYNNYRQLLYNDLSREEYLKKV